jgi:hypothetical protein
VEVAGQKAPADVPRPPKRFETPADRGKRKVIRQSINEAARKKEIEKEKAAAAAKAAERKGPRQPKPAWKRGAKHPGKKKSPPKPRGPFKKR